MEMLIYNRYYISAITLITNTVHYMRSSSVQGLKLTAEMVHGIGKLDLKSGSRSCAETLVKIMRFPEYLRISLCKFFLFLTKTESKYTLMPFLCVQTLLIINNCLKTVAAYPLPLICKLKAVKPAESSFQFLRELWIHLGWWEAKAALSAWTTSGVLDTNGFSS